MLMVKREPVHVKVRIFLTYFSQNESIFMLSLFLRAFIRKDYTLLQLGELV